MMKKDSAENPFVKNSIDSNLINQIRKQCSIWKIIAYICKSLPSFIIWSCRINRWI